MDDAKTRKEIQIIKMGKNVERFVDYIFSYRNYHYFSFAIASYYP